MKISALNHPSLVGKGTHIIIVVVIILINILMHVIRVSYSKMF